MKAPREQSSKGRVSAIREIPGLAKKSQLYLDPRFDTARGKADLGQIRANYKFLDQYRQDEINQMQSQLKTTKNAHEQAEIAAAIKSQKSRLETLQKRDEEFSVLRGLKNKKISRAKKREAVLTAQFDKMSSRERSRAIERKHRKTAQKQKKLLPNRRS